MATTQQQDYQAEKAFQGDRDRNVVHEVAAHREAEIMGALVFIETAIRAFGATPETLKEMDKVREEMTQLAAQEVPTTEAARQAVEQAGLTPVEVTQPSVKTNDELSEAEMLAKAYAVHDSAPVDLSGTDYTLAA